MSVFTPEAFEATVEEVKEKVRARELTQNHLRALVSSAFETSVDGQGRVTLGEGLRTYADLATGEPVMVVGMYDRVEIWNPERFAAADDAGRASIAAGA